MMERHQRLKKVIRQTNRRRRDQELTEKARLRHYFRKVSDCQMSLSLTVELCVQNLCAFYTEIYVALILETIRDSQGTAGD